MEIFILKVIQCKKAFFKIGIFLTRPLKLKKIKKIQLLRLKRYKLRTLKSTHFLGNYNQKLHSKHHISINRLLKKRKYLM